MWNKLPATGEGLRRTNHLVFHCGDKHRKLRETVKSSAASECSQTIDLFPISESGISLHDDRIRHLQSWFLTAARSLPEWGVTFKIAALACVCVRKMAWPPLCVRACTSAPTTLLPPGLVHTPCCVEKTRGIGVITWGSRRNLCRKPHY